MAKKKLKQTAIIRHYDGLLLSLSELLEQTRRTSARTVNAILTATYWEIGRRIVEFEQKGEKRAEYGETLLTKLSSDLSSRFGRGYSRQNIQLMRQFYLAHDRDKICQTVSGKSENADRIKGQTHPAKFTFHELINTFLLPWSHYVRLLSVDNSDARSFYETEALRGGWSVRQLDRQIGTLFYERTVLSKKKISNAQRRSEGAAGRTSDSGRGN